MTALAVIVRRMMFRWCALLCSLSLWACGSNSTTDSKGSGGASGMRAADSAFKLLWRDDFNSVDSTRWQLMTHSWNGNLALFSASTVSAQDGLLSVALKPAPSGTVDSSGAAKQFLGAEVRSRDALTYGRVRARAKLASGSAVVSSLVTIYTPWPADNWNELDVECLGTDPSRVQFNAQVYTGPPTTPPVTTAVSPTQDPHSQTLGFDASADFHVYTIEWTPDEAFFDVDGGNTYAWTKHIDLMTLPQNVLLTIWASGSPAWAGAVSDATGQAVATYDWIELYTYQK
ncbi:MAG: glycoside hydrolase family 16 protein [Polyangiaceae bacterium]